MTGDRGSTAGRGLIPGWVLGQVVGLAGTRLINLAIPWFVLVLSLIHI